MYSGKNFLVNFCLIIVENWLDKVIFIHVSDFSFILYELCKLGSPQELIINIWGTLTMLDVQSGPDNWI